MVKAKISSDILFREIKLLGHDVGREVPFLKETSCMGPTKREEYAFLEIMSKLMEFTEKHEDFTEKEFIEDFLKPSLQIWGYALWKRDVVTDLALRLGRKKLTSSFKRAKK